MNDETRSCRKRRERTKVRVVHLSSAHAWTDNRVHLREAASLAAAGYDVTLVAVDAPMPSPDTGVTVSRLPRRGRVARMLLNSPTAVLRGFRSKARIVHLHDPELVWAIPLLRFAGRIVVYDAHEDLPLQMRDKPYIHPWLLPVGIGVAHLIVRLTRCSNHIVVATDGIAQSYEPAVTTTIRNYPTLRGQSTASTARKGNVLSIVYVGGITEARGAMEMVAAMASPGLPHDVTLELAGPVSPELLRRLQHEPGWKRVKYCGTISPSEARALIGSSAIGLVVLRNTSAHVAALPTKMFEYMAEGIPVIASNFPVWRDIVNTHQCGLLVDESSPEAIAAAINTYATNEGLRLAHGSNGRAAAESSLNWTHEGKSLVELYDRLLSLDSSS